MTAAAMGGRIPKDGQKLAFEAGFDSHFPNPLELHQLLALIDTLPAD
ncbi:hypothetical protein [Ideonella sp. BN130291]|nr:hypothetical protein [Ideonella sp. BN130291]